MKHFTQKALCILLTILMVCTTLPFGALNTTNAEPKSGTKGNSLYVGEHCIETGFDTPKSLYGGKVQFKTASDGSGTLTLENISLTGADYSQEAYFKAGICLMGNHKLNIVLKGENTIEAPSLASGYGIYAQAGVELTISSDNGGSLRVYPNQSSEVQSLVEVPFLTINSGSLIIDGGKNAGKGLNSYDITINGGKLVNTGTMISAQTVTLNGGELYLPYTKQFAFFGRSGSSCALTVNGGTCYAYGNFMDCDVVLTGGTTTLFSNNKLRTNSIAFATQDKPDTDWYMYKSNTSPAAIGGAYTEADGKITNTNDLNYLKVMPKSGEPKSTLAIYGGANGEIEQGACFEYKENESIKLPEYPYKAPANSKFAGYSSDNSTVDYKVGDQITMDTDKVLYAMFNQSSEIENVSFNISIPRPGTKFSSLQKTTLNLITCSVSEIEWQTTDTVVKEGVEYTAHITIQTRTDYNGIFTTDTVYTVNGMKPELLSSGSKQVTLSCTFPAIGLLYDANVDFTGTAPFGGEFGPIVNESVEVQVAEDAPYIAIAYWASESYLQSYFAIFQECTRIALVIHIIPKEANQAFAYKADLNNITLNGETAVVLDSNSATTTPEIRIMKYYSVGVRHNVKIGSELERTFGEPYSWDKIINATMTGDLPDGTTYEVKDTGITVSGTPTKAGTFTSSWVVEHEKEGLNEFIVEITVSEIAYYTITFVDSLTGETFHTQQFKEGEGVTFPTPPQHDGYEFWLWSGMYEGEEVTSDSKVTALYWTVREVNLAYGKPFELVIGEELDKPVVDVFIYIYEDMPQPPFWLKVEPTKEGIKLSGIPSELGESAFYAVFAYLYDEDANDGIAFYYKIQISVTDGVQIKLGDVNNDGIVNTGDAVAILKAAAGMTELSESMQKVADVNKDGTMNTGDAVSILKFAAGMIEIPEEWILVQM